MGKIIAKAQSHAKRGETLRAKELYESVINVFPNNNRAKVGLSRLNTNFENKQSNKISQDILVEIEFLYNQKQFQAVIDKIVPLSKLYPLKSIPWAILGAASAQVGDLDQAIIAFKNASSVDPKDAETHYNLGTAFKQAGDLDEAIIAYTAAIKLNPKHAFALNNLGTVFEQKQMLDEAIAAYQKAIISNPNYANAYNNLGVALVQKKNFEEAKLSYHQALELNPHYAQAYYNLADVLYKLGRVEESIIASEKALLIEPNYPEALINLGNVLQSEGHLEKCVLALKKALSLAPSSVQAHYNLGNALSEQEKFSESILSYKNAISINPEYAEAYVNLARVFKLQKKFEDSLSTYRKALNIKPNYAHAQLGAGDCLRELDRLDEAISHYKLAQKCKPDFGDAFIKEGIVLQLQGKLQQSASVIQTATLLDPENIETHKALADILQQVDKLTEAIDAYNVALSIDNFDPVLYNNYGNVLKDLGRFDEARQAFRKAIEIKPDYYAVNVNLGMLDWLTLNFKSAFELMEWRWSLDAHELYFGHALESVNPTWNGEEGKDVFVWKEQGIGDEIMFSSLLSEMKEKSNRLIVECDKRLIPLYERSFPSNINFTYDRSLISAHDYETQIALGSLPKHFRHELKDFSKVSAGWLKADPARVKTIREKLSIDKPDKIIGISWFTKSGGSRSTKRNIPLDILAEYLKRVPGKYVSLQYGDTFEEIAKLRSDSCFEVVTLDEIDLFNDIDGLAALISACDTVISIDNLTVHLAGALGVETKVLLPFSSDVRWGASGSDSYWYDHLTLYRKDKSDSWKKQLECLTIDLLG